MILTVKKKQSGTDFFQVTAYLPAMQFSFVPWQYDEEVVRISREYVRIHEEIVTPIVLTAAKDVSTAGIHIYMYS